MPLLTTSTYHAPRLLRPAHFNTVYPAMFRRLPEVRYLRERWETPDGDFLDLDWARGQNDRLLIAVHGLEGSSQRSYIKGMIRAFGQKGWDGLGFNFRSCSGELNRCLHSYHMGATADLDWLIHKVLDQRRYRQIALVGFSLGGNVVLKYLGERGDDLPGEVRSAVTFSVPCHLTSANLEIHSRKNRLYMRRFMDSLNPKLVAKARRFPDRLQIDRSRLPRNFYEYDEIFTAPVHGFANAAEYWDRSSSIHYLPEIKRPTLLVNALDDTFLSRESYPYDLARQHRYLFLETPANGGHVGFVSFNDRRHYWSERRAVEFVLAS